MYAANLTSDFLWLGKYFNKADNIIFLGPKLISPAALGLGRGSALVPGAGFSPSCMSSSGFNLHHFSIMTEHVIVAHVSSQLNDETALAIIISKQSSNGYCCRLLSLSSG